MGAKTRDKLSSRSKKLFYMYNGGFLDRTMRKKEENGILIQISTYTQTKLKARIMISFLTMKALAGVLD